jgi:general secretion pathway protein K
VLWLSAALSAIAFSLANTVRGEVERTSTAVDGLKAYYLASAGVERGILYLQWAMQGGMPPGTAVRYTPGTPVLPFAFPTGQALVEIIPEAAKLNIKSSPPNDLIRLILALGAAPDRAQAIVAGIVAWRNPGGAPAAAGLNPGILPSFRGPGASFEQIEELLLIRGMTPELFYGGYDQNAEGRLLPHGGLRDCLSVFGATDRFDVNSAPPAVLAAIGMPPDAVAAVVARRRIQPFRDVGQVAAFAPGGGPSFGRLRVGGNSIFTLRSTATLRLSNGQASDVRRTVAALVKFMPAGYDAPLHILRWYDNAWTP